ncbi:quinolinate synthase NadA [Methanonatronarchaeum sp. AMET6-2]|uniref:quinolinate synthase NadA n=1 Tax=Methanonatronarchaeum sp. AMET6-2 TaxID=2933293 RepID=UPI001FF1B72F|nr:quinolinate synthase NadA [Methanonatronarchaeum sp. AMET6-2]UOY09383.1 quinolinate synthase NadA [Methanonatronarchaeum sp. AMET6-2]
MDVDLIDQIIDLKNVMGAVVLAHNYQVGEVQEVADFVGDSLGLAQRSRDVDAEYVVFAGVDFMAERASVLNPDKKIYLPSKEARCPMAGMLSVDKLPENSRRKPRPSGRE